ncbi:MAG TPA: tetratricopeptide repeat protein [Bacteroidales bacterium]|nr:tetratricopeptide repeat protein [Bacteroidales bacterium]
MDQEGIEDTELINISDPELDLKIKRCMQLHDELDEIKNDPSYALIMPDTKQVVNTAIQNKNKSGNKERAMFISAVMNEQKMELEIKNEVKSIKREMSDNNLNDLTAGWVSDWQKMSRQYDSPEARERRDFISESLKQSNVEEVIGDYSTSSVGSKRRYNRKIYLSVAAIIIGAAIIVFALLPTSGEKLFSTYYEPFQAISPVVRDAGDASASIYVSAIKFYKSGDYEKAAAVFEESSLQDPKNSSPLFYLGLTDIEKGDYSKAINRLLNVAGTQGIYSKEATWYLGLAYLKTGNIQRAKECFNTLAVDDGFYKDRSQKILRRLR